MIVALQVDANVQLSSGHHLDGALAAGEGANFRVSKREGPSLGATPSRHINDSSRKGWRCGVSSIEGCSTVVNTTV